MKTKARDRELIDVMRQYFEAKAELVELRASLERARRVTGEDIARFYDPRANVVHAGDILRSHALKIEMRSLMDRAENWARQDIGTRTGEHGGKEQDIDLLPPDDPASSHLA